MQSESRAATAAPRMRALADINVREQILVGRAAMMIKAQVDAAAVGHDIARGACAHRHVVLGLHAKIEPREEIVAIAKRQAVMAGGVARRVGFSFRLVLANGETRRDGATRRKA